MGGRHVAVRVIGITSTSHGFAYAVLEGPTRLVDWGVYRLHSGHDAVISAFDRALVKNRPLFVALDRILSARKRLRGRLFVEAVERAALARRIMILDTDSRKATGEEKPTRWRIAAEMARRFPEVAHKLPKPRKPWQSEDDRMGLFLALAAGAVAWGQFRGG